jgi:hypothetical protein
MNKIVLFLIICLTFSCNSISKKNLSGVWKLSSFEDPRMTKQGELLVNDFSDLMKGVTADFYQGSYLNFNSDSSCIFRLASSFFYGKWSLNKDTICLSTIEKDSTIDMKLVVKKLNNDKMLLMLKPNLNIKENDSLNLIGGKGFSKYIKHAEIVFTFDKDAFEYKDLKDNIYTLENNWWRVKPTEIESHEQIRKRLKASINYTIIYLNNSLLRDDKSINLNNLNPPVKLAGNGIALLDKENMPQEWKDVFYNEDQAMEAYQLINDAFTKNIEVVDKDNWIELNVDLLTKLNRVI